jgi:curli biogenesis system outer membrane secretion channel CsgG
MGIKVKIEILEISYLPDALDVTKFHDTPCFVVQVRQEFHSVLFNEAISGEMLNVWDSYLKSS